MRNLNLQPRIVLNPNDAFFFIVEFNQSCFKNLANADRIHFLSSVSFFQRENPLLNNRRSEVTKQHTSRAKKTLKMCNCKLVVARGAILVTIDHSANMQLCIITKIGIIISPKKEVDDVLYRPERCVLLVETFIVLKY